MLAFLQGGGGGSDRKLRLFAAACCRSVWGSLADERGRAAVEAAERYADEEADRQELADVEAALRPFLSAAWRDFHPPNASGVDYSKAPLTFSGFAAFFAILGRPVDAAEMAANAAAAAARTPGDNRVGPESPVAVARRSVVRWQADLLREIVGPFAFRTLPPPSALLLPWNDGSVAQLAQAAYDDRLLPGGHLDPARLWVLADALTDAGCSEDLLDHLRGAGPHVRGCWVVDLLLGKS